VSDVARILIVEVGGQSPALDILKSSGFGVEAVFFGDDAITEIDRVAPQLVLFDAHASNFAARELCRRLRSRSHRPIAVISAVSSEREVLAWFDAGADAFVAAPVGPHELVARVRALLRHQPRTVETQEPDSITIGRITLDREARQVFVDGRRISIPRREFDIAEILMSQAGRVVGRAELVRELWTLSPGAKALNVNSKSLDVQVGRLRSRLRAVEGRPVIATVRGVGYKFLLAPDVEIDLREVGSPIAASSA